MPANAQPVLEGLESLLDDLTDLVVEETDQDRRRDIVNAMRVLHLDDMPTVIGNLISVIASYQAEVD